MKSLKTFVVLLVPVLVSVAAAPASAQQPKQGTSTVILKFEKTNVPQEVMDAFYLALNEEINAQDDMHVVQGGEVTISEMILTVGCDSPDPSCLSGLSDFVDAERMVFGSIQRSKNSYLFSLKMFDFAEQRFVRKVSEQTVEGDVATVKKIVPAIVESFMYGDVGKLEVKVNGGRQPRVYFDNEKMGPAPTMLENLPLGQHAVTVKTSGGEEETKIVVLRHERTSRVAFKFGSKKVAGGGKGGGGGRSGADGMPIWPGAVATGVGGAGIIFGVVSSIQVGSLNSEADAALQTSDSGETYVNDDQLSSANASEHVQRTKGAGVRAAIGYSVGAVGLGVGGYLLYRALAKDKEGQAGKTAHRVIVAPGKNGVNLGVSVDFK